MKYFEYRRSSRLKTKVLLGAIGVVLTAILVGERVVSSEIKNFVASPASLSHKTSLIPRRAGLSAWFFKVLRDTAVGMGLVKVGTAAWDSFSNSDFGKHLLSGNFVKDDWFKDLMTGLSLPPFHRK